MHCSENSADKNEYTWNDRGLSAITNEFEHQIEVLVDRLKSANSVLFITGAGMSADSGLPTYRGVGGLYENGDTEDGLPIEVALSGPVFRRQPEITWKYLGQIERGTRGASFNRGHQVLAALENRLSRCWILTQNVDGFHTEAGSKNVIEIHGNLHHLSCTQCHRHVTVKDYSGISIPPVCQSCGALMRPEVVLFEEQLPLEALEILERELRNPFDIAISIGTSSYFPYIVQPVIDARRVGTFTIEINPTQTIISELVDLKFSVGAAQVLDEVWKRLDRHEIHH